MTFESVFKTGLLSLGILFAAFLIIAYGHILTIVSDSVFLDRSVCFVCNKLLFQEIISTIADFLTKFNTQGHKYEMTASY